MTASLQENAAVEDIAGQEHWEAQWKRRPVPNPIDPNSTDTGEYGNRLWHALYTELFHGRETAGMRLLEVGCAGSVWLPYFARQYGFRVTGIDYSPVGILQAQQMLAREDVAGDLVCCDMFQPPAGLHSHFDVVLSLGVVEHFPETGDAVAAISRFVAPGGLMVTMIPNFEGILRPLQRWLDPATLEMHMLLTRDQIADAHRASGLQIERAGYFMPINLSVLNLWNVPRGTVNYAARNLVLRTLAYAKSAAWYAIEHFGLPWPETRLLSPYIVVVARRAV
jgi:2-polyprenyl-3-methyl-5-hydroxy-6-metoxy-1,4-benzoquinol methylase